MGPGEVRPVSSATNKVARARKGSATKQQERSINLFQIGDAGVFIMPGINRPFGWRELFMGIGNDTQNDLHRNGEWGNVNRRELITSHAVNGKGEWPGVP